jgi:hypothetical protein
MTAQAPISFIDTSQARATGSFLRRFMDAISFGRLCVKQFTHLLKLMCNKKLV